MPSTEVPRVSYEPVAPYAQQVVYEQRPSLEVPVEYEQQIVTAAPKKPVWPWVVAVLAVVLGGLVGWLVANADDDDDDTVVESPETSVVVQSTTERDDGLARELDQVLDQTRTNGAYTDSGIAQLDEIVEIDRAATTESLQNQVDLLSVAQEQSVATITELEEQVATLEESLADVTAERDELKASAGTEPGGMTDSEFLARLQEKEDRISTLEDQIATASTQLTDAQEDAKKANDDLRTAQAQLQEANATLQALAPKQIENYVNTEISRLRSDASANGWFLVEQPVDNASTSANTIIGQQPAPGGTVIRGSVVYVEYDRS
jgi:flagellar biosynthesis chaperone FliJ